MVGDGTMQLLSSVCPFANVERKGESLQRKGHAWFLLDDRQILFLAPLIKIACCNKRQAQREYVFFNKDCSMLFTWSWKKMFYQFSCPREKLLKFCWPLVKRSRKLAALFMPPAGYTAFPVTLWSQTKEIREKWESHFSSIILVP